jgi:branched-chain amino acid transport system substrate-binding protein
MVITRRAAGRLAGTAAALALLRAGNAQAADEIVRVGINLSFTGADAEDASRIADGAILAFDEANAKHEVPGVTFEPVKYDDGTATAGQYDPAQAATNARKMVSDPQTMAAIGPMMSGAGKAMAPILSQGGLATITPSSTNPDITNPKFAAQYDPSGKPIYFRTVTTDAYQGPNMANYMAETLKIKNVYILDDSGAYGVGLADAYQAQIEKKGVKVLGRDRLDPKAADYSAVMTKIKGLDPEALYYGGVMQAGVKVAKQSFDTLPKLIKAGGDGVYSIEMLTGVGFPAAQGWYATIASPHLTEDPAAQAFMKAFKAKFNTTATDYAITAYSGAQVIVAAVKSVKASGKPLNRDSVRDAIQAAKVKTLIGQVSFDQYGDLNNKTVSIFQFKQSSGGPADDLLAQTQYIGTAPSA